jgi:protoporphyrinogen oxidase
LAAGFIRLRKAIANVDSYDMSRSAALDDPDVSAHDFALRHFGREVAEYLIDPMRLTSGTGAREASTVNVLGALGAWSSGLRSLRGGLATFSNELASRLDVRYGATVTRVDETESGVNVSYTDGSGTHDVSAGSRVISAMYHRAVEMWPSLLAASPAFGDKLRNVHCPTTKTPVSGYPCLIDPTHAGPRQLESMQFAFHEAGLEIAFGMSWSEPTSWA